MDDNFLKFGRSGCSFYLDETGINLRKISSEIGYNHRLHSQFLKQSKFKPAYSFSTPIPYRFDSTNELHYFDMEYIRGKTFNSFCLDSNVDEIIKFSHNIKSFIEANLNNSILTEINFGILENKIYYLRQMLSYELSIYFDFLLENPLYKLPIGNNHGDFTMSNIIFSDKYYLIDFLDNPYETPLNDLIKIKQDTHHNFYFNLLGKMDTKVKLCLDYIDNELNIEFKDIISSKEFIWLSIFNLLRVLPYLRNSEEINTILRGLKVYEYYITSCR